MPKPAPKPRLVVSNTARDAFTSKPTKTVNPLGGHFKRSKVTNQVMRAETPPSDIPDLRTLPGDPKPIGKPNDFSGCRFIFGDTNKPDWRCCGHEQAPGSSYCRVHDERVRGPQANYAVRKRNAERLAGVVAS